MKEFNFKLEPGRKLYNNREYVETFPLISVIVPFYNSEKFIEQTIKSILNQTFPCYEILIIDDGSTNKMALEKLEQIKELDKRIKVFHKQNEGLATTRDYGASKSNEHARYLMFIDDDDLIEPTFLECGFWTLETNKDAAWAYSDSLGFGSIEYTWNKYFSSEKMKKENDLISAALVRKTDFFLVNGYNLKEKAVNEDWNFWLKLLSKEKFPVHISFYGEWYRRKENGELQRSRENKERYEITIISTEGNENVLRQEFENNENVRVYDLTSFLDKRYWVAFVNYIIQKENINLIFNSNSKTGYSMLPYLKSMYPEIPILDYVHMEEWYNRNGGYSRYSSMYNSIIDKTMVCNGNSKKILEEHFKRNPDEVQTVYIGVDEEKFNPDRYNKEELEKKYLGGTTNKKIISFICRISEQKRPLLFLEIIKKLKEKRQDFKVLVVGDGNLLGKMKEKAKKMNLLEDIIFWGEIKNTVEIYKISNVTVNCSLKEGLALTSYESLSMNVPIVSSDVGGQKELISKDVGEIVKLMQNEEDVYLEKYSPEEINSYVKSINKVLDNLETYKSNCRKRICENFTISKMIEKMDSIFEETHKNPSKKKIENGYGLSKNKDITKELITANFKSDELEYKWECSEYERKVYGKNYSVFGLNSRKELLKEKLWQIPAWRFMIKIYHKIR